MSIMEKIFGVRPTPVVVQQPGITNNLQTNPVPQGTQQSQTTAPNGVVPKNNESASGNQTEQKSPLETHSKLWEPVKVEEPKEKQPTQEELHAKMMEAANKVDFSKVVDAESLKKIVSGGEDAAQALVGLLNKTAQTVYGQSAVTTQKLVDRAVAEAEQRFAEKVPALVKNQSAKDSLFTEHPAFANPVTRPVVEAIQNQLSVQYPKATPQELNKMAKEILEGTAAIFAPKQKEATKAGGAQEEDWTKYFEGSSE